MDIGTRLSLQVRCHVVLDPQLGTSVDHQLFDAAHGRNSERRIYVYLWDPSVLPTLAEVVEVASQNNRPLFSQIHEEHLMPGRMAWCRNNSHPAISEHIVLSVE